MRDSVETKPRSGRPTNASDTTARKIVWDAKKDPQMTWAGIQYSLSCMPEESHYYTNATKQCAYNTPGSTETSLKPSGTKLFGVMSSKIELFGHEHNLYIQRGVNKAYDEKYTMVWRCVMHKGTGNSFKLDGNMNTACYQKITGGKYLYSWEWKLHVLGRSNITMIQNTRPCRPVTGHSRNQVP